MQCVAGCFVAFPKETLETYWLSITEIDVLKRRLPVESLIFTFSLAFDTEEIDYAFDARPHSQISRNDEIMIPALSTVNCLPLK